MILTAILLCCLFPQTQSAFSARIWLRSLEEDGYDSSVPPGVFFGEPTEVAVSMYIESIGNFQPLAMEYEIDLYFAESWYDQRLRHNQSFCFHLNTHHDMDRVWRPDVYLANSKEARYNDVTVPNHSLQICARGTVRYSIRINAKMQCHMNLRRFPFDSQVCGVKILPYGNNTTRVILVWAPNPIIRNSQIQDADLQLEKMEPNICNGSYTEFSGNFSCLLGQFYFRRAISQSVLQIYCPSLIIVCISWISFWIDPTSVPGRVGLAVTTLLTSATQTAGIAFTMPSVGYAKALDVWLTVCLFFLFGSLIEFTLVNMYTRRWQSLCRKETGNMKVKKFPLLVMSEESYEVMRERMCEQYRERSKSIDKISRALFPGLFFIFVIIYIVLFAI